MKILQFTKKSLAFIFIAIFGILAQFTIIYSRANYYSYAYTVDTTEDMLSNANFESSSSTSKGKPNSPSYWSTAGGDEDNVTKGVIDTTNDTFNNNNGYGLSSNPLTSSSTNDRKILLIDSKGINTRFGYKNSTEMTLSANSYYRISVLCKTNTVSNGASIYLTGSSLPTTNQYNFVDIVTNANADNGWSTYTFYVKTDISTSTKAYLELWLGSKQENNIMSNGQVYFDNIKVQSIDQNTYYDCTVSYNFDDETNMPSNIRKLDLTGKAYSSQFTNSNFEDGLTGWEKTSSANDSNAYSGITLASSSNEMLKDMHLDNDQTVPGNTLSHNNTKALYINHLDDNGSYTEYTSDPITIKQHSFAMITYYSKTGNITLGGAYATVKTTSSKEDAPTLSVAEYNTSSTGLDNYNGYALTTIYIEGNPYRDTDITLSLGLGTKDSYANGYVLFDDIAVYEISYTSYNSASSNKLALYNDSDTSTILNCAFNFNGSSDTAVAYPIPARNWTISNSISGIISINKAKYDENFNNGNYGVGAIYPGPVTSYPNVNTDPNTTVNNVLMLRNETPNVVTATSDSFTLSETTTISISVYVKVQDNLSNTNSGANISLVNGKNVLARISGIKDTEWTKYTIYFKNTQASIDLQLVLGLGTDYNTTSGYTYFDNVSYTSGIEDSEVEARDKTKSAFTNLETNNFDSYVENGTDIYTPTTMTSETPTNATIAGVINTSKVSNTTVNFDIPTREGSNRNLLMIKNNAPINFTYKTNYEFTFASGSHYVVNVWIYTYNLTGTEENYGVNIALSNVEKSFSNVSSKLEANENQWTKYSFYVSNSETDSIVSTLSISLGSEDCPTQGFVFVDTISVETLEASDYNEAESNDYTIKTIAKVEETSSDDEEDEKTSSSISGVNYWILASSLIVGLALIIAIIGMAMRHLNYRMPRRYRKGKKSDYNRENSLNNADVKRELQVIRNAKIKELDKQIDETKAKMQEEKHTYETSINGLDNEQKVEKLFTKYAKANSKLQKEIDNLESAKKYLLDEANIKLEEQKEIRRRQMLLEEENRLIQQNQSAIEKELKKEKQEQEAKIEAGKKKARLKSKK